MNPLTIIANIKVKPEHLEFVKEELLKLIDVTRAEKGCIAYQLHQDKENPAHFLFYETWESRELWLIHIQAKPLADYKAATEEFIEEFTVNEMALIA